MPDEGADVQKAKEVWRNVDAVIFAFDSTLVQESAIFELSKFCNKDKGVLELANKAMAKQISYKETLHKSINIIKPSLDQIQKFNSTHSLNLTPKIKELLQKLQSRNVAVYVVSGSFKCLLHPFTRELKIPDSNIYANLMKFYYEGDFAGYKEDQPTTESTSKVIVATMLKNKYGYKNLVNIGAGYTDLEARDYTDAFIGYGGNIARDAIKKGASWYIYDFGDLIEALKKS